MTSDAFTDLPRDQRTIGQILRLQATRRPEKTCLIYRDTKISYGELDQITNRLANGLRRLGVARNENVTIMLPNCLEFIFAWIALNKLGAVEYPLNVYYKGFLLEQVLNYSDARVLIVGEQYLPTLQAIEPSLTKLKKIVVLPSPTGESSATRTRFEAASFSQLYDLNSTPPSEDIRYWETASIMNTAGTTGPSKGVLLSHNRQYTMARNLSAHVDWGEDSCYYQCWPLYHNLAHGMILLPAFLQGASVVLADRFSARAFWADVATHNISSIYLTGTVMPILLQQPPGPHDTAHRIKYAYAYPRPVDLARQFEERFGLSLVELYGGTEANINTLLPLSDRRPGSCGVEVPDNEVKLFDAFDNEVPVGDVGEIVVRPKESFFICSGYYKMPEATAEAMRNCWWHTGDLGRRDRDGFFYFVDRKKDAIRRAGENIASRDIETAVNLFPGVLESAAIPVPAELGEDDILVVVRLSPETHIVPADLIRSLEQHLPHFAVPRYIRIKESLPKSIAERIQKFQLRQEGITPDTWDRVKAGIMLKHELSRNR